jgi:hypothetical protein
MSLAPERSFTIKDVVTDFLASAPPLEALADYRLPEALQQRAHDLLEKNRHGSLTEDERVEMEAFRDMDHLLTLVKTKARLRLQTQT